ncbi:uncharacterized protein [Nicotiana sylvestris]|uniref:uncharacterized protein n=1 Tax=Nicotiana sylvestris TaxID=4096 RepID=UPI00388C794E
MSVTDYEARISELSRNVLMILPTDTERVRRIVVGLHSGIRANIAREVEMGTSYQLVLEITRRIEGYRLRGRGQPATTQLGGGQPASALARFYALPTRPDVVASDVVITGIISVCGRDASALFDLGFTYSYVLSLFARFLVIIPEPLDTPVHVSTPVGDSMVVDWIYRSCVVTFYGFETRADLMLLDMINFEVILGMDWLYPYQAILDCHAKSVTLVMPGLEWKGSTVDTSSQVISFLKARQMVEKGCLAYLAYVRDTTAETPTIDSVPVVQEFSYVFPSDLPGMPPDCDIDFFIDLALGTQPISIPPYCMAPKELKDLKE